MSTNIKIAAPTQEEIQAAQENPMSLLEADLASASAQNIVKRILASADAETAVVATTLLRKVMWVTYLYDELGNRNGGKGIRPLDAYDTAQVRKAMTELAAIKKALQV